MDAVLLELFRALHERVVGVVLREERAHPDLTCGVERVERVERMRVGFTCDPDNGQVSLSDGEACSMVEKFGSVEWLIVIYEVRYVEVVSIHSRGESIVKFWFEDPVFPGDMLECVGGVIGGWFGDS